MLRATTKDLLRSSGFFGSAGAWVLVDGQFGSTGKGLASSVLAEALGDKVTTVVSNAGPNSGHTSYGPNNEKVVLTQLPTFSVASLLYNTWAPETFMSAGAIINPSKFNEEANNWLGPWTSIDPAASVVTDEVIEADRHLISAIGSTGKGTGAAQARKIMRNPGAVMQEYVGPLSALIEKYEYKPSDTVLLEVSQGFSLSLNASGMYPFTTSRDCTVMQAMSDACIHPAFYRGAMMVIRTFPIRVAGNSGPCYADQYEISWDDLGVDPEITTVTKKVRRVFTFSDLQFRRALEVNRPCSLFVNFMQYLPKEKQDDFLWGILKTYNDVMGHSPRIVLTGWGPYNSDVDVFGGTFMGSFVPPILK